MSNLRKLISLPKFNRDRKNTHATFPRTMNTFIHKLAVHVVEEAFLPYIIKNRDEWVNRFVQLLIDSGREQEVIENVTYKRYYNWANQVFGSKYGIRRIELMAPEYAYCHAELSIGNFIGGSKEKYEYHRKNFSVVWVNIANTEIIHAQGFLEDFFYDYLGRLICRVFWHRRTKGNVKLFTEHVKNCVDPKDILLRNKLKVFTIPCIPICPCEDIVRLVITENV